MKRGQSRQSRVVLSIYLVAYLMVGSPLSLYANPSGENVVSGNVIFDRSQADRLNVIQSSDKAIVNWQQFNIDTHEHTDVQMPSSGSVNLSRVTGGDPSSILGKLTSNGNLFLINPNGILFGSGSSVDVHGLVATTSDIDNDDFLAGKYHFQKAPAAAATVINRGNITVAEGGLAAFVAPGVENSGVIQARLGRLSLASGNTFTLDLYGDELVSLGINGKILNQVIGSDGQPVSALVKNSGGIHADGGTVFLGVEAAQGVVDEVINMSGIIEAKTAEMRNGEIVLSGGKEGIVRVEGRMDASGKREGETGGTVKVLGEKVGLFKQARVDASGDGGGGEVLIGGNFQGKGPEQNSQATFVSPDAKLNAEALAEGNGGKIIIWSDGITRYFGSADVQAGFTGGDGGLVEVSGKENLIYRGKSFLGAPNGKAGELLLDPTNISISTSADSNTAGFTAGLDNTEAFTDDSGQNSTFDIDAGESFSGVGNGATINLQATNDITVAIAWDVNASSGNTGVNVTLRARNDVTLNAGITMDGAGNLFITADDNDDGAGSITGSGTLTMGTGDLALSAGDGIGTAGTNISTSGVTDFAAESGTGGIFLTNTGGSALNFATVNSITGVSATTSGNVRITNSAASGTIAVSQAVTANDGFVRLNSGGNMTDSAVITATTSATFIADDDDADIILDQGHAVSGSASFTTNGTSGNVTFDNGTTALDIGGSTVDGNLTVTSGGAITDSGTLTVSGTSSFTTDVNDIDITLNNTNAMSGAVSFTTQGTGGDVTVDNGTTALNLGASTIRGNLTATSGGAITDSGALTITGTASFTADVDNIDITLDQTDNAITGAVTFTTQGTGGDVTIDNGTTELNLGASTVNGNFTATSGGQIVDSGALTVTGTASFTTDVANQSITLDTATNAITGAVTATTTGSGDFTLDNGTTALNLGTIDIGRDFTVTSGQAITDSGVITVGGASSFTTDVANRSITLDTTTNAMSGAISFTSSGNGDIYLDNGTNATDLGTVNIGRNLTVVAGNRITDSGVLTVPGTASFTTDVADQDVFLNTTTNAITGRVQFTTRGTGNVTFDNGTTAMDLGPLNIGNNLTLTTRTDQTLSDPIAVPGRLDITIGTDSALTVNTELSGNNEVRLRADDNITFAENANITTSGGPITVTADNDNDNNGDGGLLTMANGTVFDAGSGTITLSGDENVTLGRLLTTGGGDAAVSVTSSSGAIIDGGDRDTLDIEAKNGRVVLNAANGIGDPDLKSDVAGDSAIEIEAATLDVVNEQTGDIQLYEEDDVTIVRLHNYAPGGKIDLSFERKEGGEPIGAKHISSNQGIVQFLNREKKEEKTKELAVETTVHSVDLLEEVLVKAFLEETEERRTDPLGEHDLTDLYQVDDFLL